MLKILTAGESHGKALVAVIEGFPAGVPIDREQINEALKKRQQGYGRGKRMAIESDEIEILSGLRGGFTLGSPIAFTIANRDYENWQRVMDPEAGDLEEKVVTKVRPGHGDLAGVLKYGFDDARNVLERASARETALQVAVGDFCRQLLTHFGIRSYSHVTAIGGKIVPKDRNPLGQSLETFAEDSREIAGELGEEQENIRRREIRDAYLDQVDQSPVRCGEEESEKAMMNAIDQATRDGDSLGGVFEVIVENLPVGLGSYVQSYHKLDGRLAGALMAMQSVKAVEIGEGFPVTEKSGSRAHDEIYYNEARGYYRKTNRAGGIEGGMSNGEPLMIRCGVKPIPTLRKPLNTVDIRTKKPGKASKERSDHCAVPSASLVGEAIALIEVTKSFLTSYGQDSLEKMVSRWKNNG